MAGSTHGTLTQSSASNFSDKDGELGIPPVPAVDPDHIHQDEEDGQQHVGAVDEESHGGALEKHATGKSKRSIRSHVPSVNDVTTVPNGGAVAWMQVVGSFCIFFNTWGLINAYGVYMTYYETHFLKQWSASDISWIGSVQAFLLMFIGPLSGPIYDAGYFRPLLAGGSFLVVFGLFMLSLCTEYWQIFLAQGLCIGTGAGLLFVPGVAILSTYFNTKLATATGLAASGSSLGGVIYPIALNQLLDQVGFAWATRVLGFISLATLVTANLTMRVRVLPVAKRQILDLSAFKEVPYVLWVVGSLVGFMGLYAPFFYVEYFSITLGITSTQLAFYALPIINAGSVLGRIVPNYVADHIGPLNVITPAALVSGALVLGLIATRTQPALIAICVLYGFFSGALVSLPPTVLVHLSSHRRGMIGTRMGMCFFITSIGLLLGAPICGWILDASNYNQVWIFGGVMLLVGGLFFLGTRLTRTGLANIWVKA